MRVIKVTERSSINIPLSELLHDGGMLKLRSDLIGKGLVEVKQAQNSLKLQINGLVGRLPLTDRITLDVQPKFPVSNLNRMVYSSRGELLNPFFLDRPYEKTKSQDYLPVPLIRSYSAALSELVSKGIYREYQRETVTGPPKPRINIMKTQQRFWSRLNPTMAVMERFNFTHDNLPNQCIKLATTKALSISKNSTYLQKCVPVLAESLRQLEKVTLRNPGSLISDLKHVRSMVPSFRQDYASALEQALEIIRHVDVSLNTAQHGLSLESYVISLDDVFERYIRSIIRELPEKGFGRVATVDGNIRRHQRSLFNDNNRYKVKPDLIIKDNRGARLIGDVKYKIKPKEEDRYQIITHALSYQVSRAFLVYPKPPAQTQTGLQRLGLIGLAPAVEVFEYYFEMDGDLPQIENDFLDAVSSLVT